MAILSFHIQFEAIDYNTEIDVRKGKVGLRIRLLLAFWSSSGIRYNDGRVVGGGGGREIQGWAEIYVE